MFFALIFMAWLILAVALGVLANQRGRDGFHWFLIGAVLTPLLGFVLLMMKKAEVPSGVVNSMHSINYDHVTYDLEMTHQQCPSCLEYVKRKSTVCSYCGHQLNPDLALFEEKLAQKKAEEAELRRGQQKNLALAIGVAIALGVLAWLAARFTK